MEGRRALRAIFHNGTSANQNHQDQLILSKYGVPCCAIDFRLLIPYQITFNKGQYITHMVVR